MLSIVIAVAVVAGVAAIAASFERGRPARQARRRAAARKGYLA